MVSKDKQTQNKNLKRKQDQAFEQKQEGKQQQKQGKQQQNSKKQVQNNKPQVKQQDKKQQIKESKKANNNTQEKQQQKQQEQEKQKEQDNKQEVEKNQQEQKADDLKEQQEKIEQLDRYYNSESDDTDDEIINAKIGRVPWKWYDNYKHIGYDADLKKITKPTGGDKIDELIKKAEDPNWYRTIRDELNQTDVVLTDEQLQIIKRLIQGKFASKQIAETDYTVEYEYNNPMPLDGRPIPKRKFMPSKWERMMVNKIVTGIKMGTIQLDKEEEEQDEDEMLFDLWDNNEDDDINRKMPVAISAPKMKLPTNAESYNPPEEYLLSKKELKEWKDADPEDRETNFIPKKYDCLRHVEFYDNLVKERFDRCLDLYLCPRARKKKLDIDPESLIPKMPKPEELRPYPTTLSIQYIGHKSRVRGQSVLFNGQYLASVDEKGEIIVWEVSTSRIIWRYQVEQIGYAVQFTSTGLLCVASDTNLYIFNIKKILPKALYEQNEETLQLSRSNNIIEYNQKIKWEYFNIKQQDNQEGEEQQQQQQKDEGLRVKIKMNDQIKSLSVHAKGDYISTVAPMASKKNESVLVHSLSKGMSSQPFNKTKGIVEKVLFHSKKPILFILTRRHCFVYNLQKQATVKKLLTGAQWNSSIDLHPYGDNLIIGTYDKKVLWFDLDLQTTPYKNLRYHEKAVRNVCYHKKYPLMASCSDDGSINILHAKVHTDMLENALILPVKMLKGHTIRNELGVLDIQFHPTQPWIFSSGADHRIFLWT